MINFLILVCIVQNSLNLLFNFYHFILMLDGVYIASLLSFFTVYPIIFTIYFPSNTKISQKIT